MILIPVALVFWLCSYWGGSNGIILMSFIFSSNVCNYNMYIPQIMIALHIKGLRGGDSTRISGGKGSQNFERLSVNVETDCKKHYEFKVSYVCEFKKIYTFIFLKTHSVL